MPSQYTARTDFRPKTAAIRILAFALIVAATTHGLTGAQANESVRAELIRLQEQTGLTLASFYSGDLEVVLFTSRYLAKTDNHFTGLQTGLISPDGTEAILLGNRSFTRFTTANLDGTGVREYPQTSGGYRMCWNYDRSRILMSVEDKSVPFHTTLKVLDVPSKTTRDIDSSAYIFLTPQCWSPDGKQFVYETQEQRREKKNGSSETVNATIKIFEFDREKSHEVAKGSDPSWSPDGAKIAFRNGDTYFAISSPGDNTTALFHKSGIDSGLAWSPDSRFVAYTSHNGALERPFFMDVGPVRLRVRRLSDNSEDWVLQLYDSYLPDFQWLENKELVSRAQAKIPPK